MKKREMTVDIVWANAFSLILLAALFIAGGAIWYLSWGFPIGKLGDFEPDIFGFKFLIFFICFLVGIVVHELIHGITWAIYSKNGWKDIKFGILPKMLTPYCHCKEPMLIRRYIIGALMPLFVLGVLPTIAGLVAGEGFVFVFGLLFIASAAGDILIVWKIRKEPSESLVLDHPSEAGCYIFEEGEETEKEQN